MYEIYCKLKDSRDVKDTDVVRATGITKSTFSDWKSGRSMPKQDKMQKIADYFGVTVDYLMTGEEKQGYYLNEETAKLAQEMFEDDSYTIFLNAKLTHENQLKSYHHALKHIEKDDFCKENVQEIEIKTHE